MLSLLAALATAHATTFVVDTTDDTADAVPGDGVCADAAGRCSLHAALDELPFEPELRIELPAGDFPHARTTRITHAIGPDDARSLEIVGEGPGQTRVLPATTWLSLTGGQLTLRDLAVEGVEADYWGAIFVEPKPSTSPVLEIERVAFRDNHARHFGGAIALEEGSTLRVFDSRFERNVAGRRYGGIGGAILSFDNGGRANDILIEDSTFVANATNGAAGVYVGSPTINDQGVPRTQVVLRRSRWLDHKGTAVEVQGVALTIEDCLFEGNRGPRYAPGALDVLDTALTVSRTRFSGNRGYRGGAVAMEIVTGGRPQASTMVFEDSVFVGNEATSAGGAVFAPGGEGILQFRRCEFVGNRTSGSGGALNAGREGAPIIQDSWFVDNEAGGHGGGVVLGVGFVASCDVSGSLFWNNRAGDDGGGLYARGNDVFPSWDMPCGLEGLTFVGNQADSDGDGHGRGGGLHVSGQLYLSGIVAEGNTQGPSGRPDDCAVDKTGRSWIPGGRTEYVLPFTTGDSRFAATADCGTLYSARSAIAYRFEQVSGWDETGTAAAPLAPALAPVQYTDGRPWFEPLPGGPLVDRIPYSLGALHHLVQEESGTLFAPPPYRIRSAFDLRGDPRLVDGDGDGTRRRDIGAVELQTP